MIELDIVDNVINVSFKYNPIYVQKIKGLPTRRYNPDNRTWQVPIGDLDLLIGAFKDIPIKGLEKEKQEVKKEDYKNRLKDIKPTYAFDFKTKPFPHQIEGFNVGIGVDKILLADEQGLGKTKQSIDIAIARKLRDGVQKALIVCGVNSTKYNWQKEVEIHSDESSIVIDGSTKVKLSLIEEWRNSDTYFGVINIESLRKEEILKELKDMIKKKQLKMLIVDEIHKAKNGESVQGKALRGLQAEYGIGLTGTPITNKAEDLWNILTWLGAEKRNFFAFRNRYCELGYFRNVVGYKNLDELSGVLNKVMLRRKKDEVLDLPPKIRVTDYLEMSAKQKEMYRQVRLSILTEYDDIKISPNPLSKLIRLRQVTGGVLGGFNTKLDRLEELMQDIKQEDKKAVVFTNWSEVARNVCSKLSSKYKVAMIDGSVSVEERQKIVDRYQKGEYDVLVGTIGAMGTGLTLTKGSYVIFMDKAFSPADNEQAEDRCHRIGTNDTINVITLVCKDSIDERIEEILATKKDLFTKVVEGAKDIKDKKALLNYLLDVKED